MWKSKLKKSKQKSKKQPAGTQTPTLSKKELAAQKRKAARARKEFIGFTSAVMGVAVVIGLALFPLGGAKMSAGAIAAIASICLSYKYPRTALWFFLIYMPFSGTITYWIGGGNLAFQLAKDAFYLPPLIALIQECKRKRLPILLPKKLVPTLAILLTACILILLFVNVPQQLDPNNIPKQLLDSKKGAGQPILMGILGLKVFMGYIPLISCAYYQIRNKKELLFLTRLHVVLAIICCGLGVVQYMLLVTHICEGTDHLTGSKLFKATLEYKCLVGGSLVYSPSQKVIRLPGTFVAPWQWAWFLIGNTFFSFASAFSDPSLFWQIASFISMALVFVNAIISGQRIALALVPIFIAILLVLTGQVTNLKRFLPIVGGLAILAVVGMAAFPQVIQERVDSFIGRWNAGPPTAFIQDQLDRNSRESGFLGNGLGRATNSARPLGGTALIETYYPKMLFEVGWLGVIAFLIVVTTLTILAFKAYRSLKDKSLRSYAASFWVFVLFISYNTYYYPLDVDPVAVYYWFFAGVIFKLPEIDRQEAEKLEGAQESQPQVKKKLPNRRGR